MLIASQSETSSALVFTASLPAAVREQVESLFYFNPRQGAFIAQIRRTVEETGAPAIEQRERRIWIGVPDGSTQCLFACSPPDCPLGVALYSRPSSELIRILHLAIAPADSTKSGEAGDGIASALVDRIRHIASRIKGVQKVQLPYRPGCFLRVLS